MKPYRHPASLGILILIVAALVWLYSGTDNSLQRLQAGAPLRIGYAVEPPYAVIEADGKLTGEAPEIARRIAAALGIKQLEWRQLEFGELIPELENGSIDVITAGMFITPDRAKRVAFSDPTWHVRPGLLVSRDNPKGILSYRQASSRPELRIAVLAGSIEEQLIQEFSSGKSQPLRVPDALTGRVAVEAGLADALMLSEPSVRWLSRQNQLGSTDAVFPESTPGDDMTYGRTAFAFRLSERALRQGWNKALHAYLGSKDHRELLVRLGLSSEVKP